MESNDSLMSYYSHNHSQNKAYEFKRLKSSNSENLLLHSSASEKDKIEAIVLALEEHKHRAFNSKIKTHTVDKFNIDGLNSSSNRNAVNTGSSDIAEA